MYFYSDSEDKTIKTETPAPVETAPVSTTVSTVETGEIDEDTEPVSTGKETESGQIEDDSDDDDDVEITIGDIKTGQAQYVYTFAEIHLVHV